MNVPPMMRLLLIIDTGADTSMLNDQHMRTLGIPVRGQKDILTATTDHKAAACGTYDVELQIASYGDAPLIIPAIEVLGRPLFNHSIDGMIGRDVLERVVLTVDGPGRRFKIDWHER